MQMVAAIGRSVLGLWRYLGQFVELLGATLGAALRIRRDNISVIARVSTLQLLFTGFQAVFPLTVAAVALGILVLSISVQYLPVEYVQGVASVVVIREVVPLLTAFLLIGRSGTAITIEVANMKLNDELSALQVMNIPIAQFVVLPRLFGMVTAFVLLQIYADLAALVGGYWGSALIEGHLPSYHVSELLSGIDPADILVSRLKTVLFGIVISITAIQNALHVRISRREVPIVTSRAVVRSLLGCFVLNTAVSLSA